MEHGLGRLTAEPEFARTAEAPSRAALPKMLATESGLGIRASYNLVEQILPEIDNEIRADGHPLAFHSFDYGGPSEEQLWHCREVDYQLEGYRAPQSKVVCITDRMLSCSNFGWFASSANSLDFDMPRLSGGVTTVPVHSDDFGLHTRALQFDEWETAMLASARRRRYTAIGLHDCYAEN